jgi:hypothetical protein
MKIAINICFGGFGLSPLAMQEYAKRKGKECYFFRTDYSDKTMKSVPCTLEEAQGQSFVSVYTVPNPEDYRLNERDEDGLFAGANQRAREIHIYDGDIPRDDPDLVAVVEQLGKKANGTHAELKVVEIPDGVEWEIQEYDGSEHVAEVHRTWC